MMRATAVRAQHQVSRVSASRATHKVTTIDACARQPNCIAAYALSTHQPPGLAAGPIIASLVENNNSHAAPDIMAALDGLGVRAACVRYLIVTHVHLDHAAGTGTLLKACPNAIALCHPRAKKHLVDPTALIKSARAVYSPAEFDEMVGEMLPCDDARVRTVGDGEVVEVAPGRPLSFLHTEGHAKHHFVVHDAATASAFTGDSFGMSYDRHAGRGLAPATFFPTSSPVDFDFPEAMASVKRIAALAGLERVYPTHFGATEDVAGAEQQMLAMLPRFEALRCDLSRQLQRGVPRAEVLAAAEAGMRALLEGHLRERGLTDDDAGKLWTTDLRLDISVNALGLVVGAERFPVAKL
jgi:glyoxylase-like metal-dependent hydrolase (beta-lactamase superfamily II)